MYDSKDFTVEAIARVLGVSRASIYRHLVDPTSAGDPTDGAAAPRLCHRRRPRRPLAVPVALADAVDRAGYGRFPEHLERDWLGRWCHLSEADVRLVRRRAEETTRLGFAAQLVTVRAIGTFLADPAAVPAPIVASVARQLGIVDPGS
jgi:hypothetical protein